MKIIRCLSVLLALISLGFAWQENTQVPKVYTEKNLHGLLIPLVDSTVIITHLPVDMYYDLPERVVYKSYPLYLPGTEPEGYIEWLKQQEPAIVFDASQLHTEQDWITAGELVYDNPENFYEVPLDNPQMHAGLRTAVLQAGWLLAKDSSLVNRRIYIREKGKLETGDFSCGFCHTRGMPDGTVFKGGQGNHPFDADFARNINGNPADTSLTDSMRTAIRLGGLRALFGAYWIKDGLQSKMLTLNADETVASLTNTYGGVMHRHGSVLGEPTSIPDLYNLDKRKYLDHTGLMRNDNSTDIMLYATLNQQADRYDKYNGKTVMALWPNEGGQKFARYSDAQLFALVKFLLSLKAPKNPETFSTEMLQRGERLFKEQGCVTCHTPPLYSNNMLTPVDGFEPPAWHMNNFNVFNVSIETNPGLALYSRRGTGYYKVPSLIAVWNRTALLHNGSIRSLEELFDPARLNEDYVPKGYKPGWVTTYAVKGHPFGLDLNTTDKKALIAFLKSL